MNHLFNTYLGITRMTQVATDGQLTYAWAEVGVIQGRLDLVFQRQGRDDLVATVEAGRTPERGGLLFCEIGDVRIGDRLVVKTGSYAFPCTLEVINVPEPVPGYMGTHHLEIVVKELAQSLTGPAL